MKINELDIQFTKIQLQDTPALHKLASENGGNTLFNEKNFKHWYLKNPTNSSSLWKVEVDKSIEGFATTNNFLYTLNNKDYLVALPQNVLTSKKCRGKGLFSKLYYITEKENIEVHGVDFFLTSTGEMSTPIFLTKFDYLRGICPPVLICFFSLKSLISKVNYQIINDINQIDGSHFNLDNARKKNISYFKWRYSDCDKNKLSIISISENSQRIGYAFLIAQKKNGLSFLILADIICEKEKDYSKIINTCHVFATKNFFAGLILFELKKYQTKMGLNITMNNKFNFLVKAKNMEETTKLSQIEFNFFFGDFDYFW